MVADRGGYGSGLTAVRAGARDHREIHWDGAPVKPRAHPSVGVRGGEVAQSGDGGGGVVGAVDGAAGHEDPGPGLGGALDGAGGDSAVDLDAQLEALFAHQAAGPFDLGQHRLDEGLAAESGFYGHEQQEVDAAEQVLDGGQGRGGAQGDAGAGAQAVQLVGQAEGGGRGLDVGGDDRRPGFGVGGGPAVGVLDR